MIRLIIFLIIRSGLIELSNSIALKYALAEKNQTQWNELVHSLSHVESPEN